MRIILLSFLLLSGCESYEASGLPVNEGEVMTLTSGYSMYPVLVPGDYFQITSLTWDDIEEGMIVRRWYLGQRNVHKVGVKVMRDRWVTYGINNSGIDPIPMDKSDFMGVVKVL